jgi:replication factor A1
LFVCCLGGGGGDSFEKRKTISAIRDENLGMDDKPDYVGLKASVSYIKHDNECWYTACPTEGCNKKVGI